MFQNLLIINICHYFQLNRFKLLRFLIVKQVATYCRAAGRASSSEVCSELKICWQVYRIIERKLSEKDEIWKFMKNDSKFGPKTQSLNPFWWFLGKVMHIYINFSTLSLRRFVEIGFERAVSSFECKAYLFSRSASCGFRKRKRYNSTCLNQWQKSVWLKIDKLLPQGTNTR